MPQAEITNWERVRSGSLRTTEINKITGVTKFTNTNIDSNQYSANKWYQKVWSRTPNFRELRASGAQLPDNPLSTVLMNEGHHYATSTHISDGPEKLITRVWEARDNNFVPSRRYSYFANSEFASKLIVKAKGAQWNAPVFFKEAGKTVEMVLTAASRIATMTRALRKGDFATFVKNWHPSAVAFKKRQLKRATRKFTRAFGSNPQKAAGNAWLEYTYGWTPLLLDVKSAAETLASLSLDEQSQVGSVRAHLSHRIRNRKPLRAGHGGVNWDFTGFWDEDLSGRAVWRYKPNENLNAIGKLGLTNPLEVGWELVPFSFVVDWFVPVGDYLSSLDAPMRFSHKGGSYGFKQSTGASHLVAVPEAGWTCSPNTLPIARLVSVTASPMTSIPSMSLLDQTFRPSLGASRIASGLSLMLQNLRWFR